MRTTGLLRRPSGARSGRIRLLPTFPHSHILARKSRTSRPTAAIKSNINLIVRQRAISERTAAMVLRPQEDAIENLGAVLDPKRVPAAQKLIEAGLSPVGRQNGLVLAGQRITASLQRCAKKLLRLERHSGYNLLMTPDRLHQPFSARITSCCTTLRPLVSRACKRMTTRRNAPRMTSCQ